MAEYNGDNIFRKILDGVIPCHKIFEDDHVLAILDAFPSTPGHSLLIPKCNSRDVSDMVRAAPPRGPWHARRPWPFVIGSTARAPASLRAHVHHHWRPCGKLGSGDASVPGRASAVA